MRAPERSLNNKKEEKRKKEYESATQHKAHITIHTAHQHNSTHSTDVLGLPQHRHDGDGDVSEGPGRHDVLNQVQEGCR